MLDATHAIPVPRTPPLSFDGVPRHWLANSAAATHIVNGVSLLFPSGERFFVRSVHAYMDQIEKDPLLKAQVRGFFGQEGRHAQMHDRHAAILEEQGFKIGRFLKFYEKFAYSIVERMAPKALNLATTVACEHFTAIMAESAFSDAQLLNDAHPAMQALLLWHAAEEIEHKAVAFDVLKSVNPSYPLRMLGLFMATMMLTGFWIMGTCVLLWQDKERGKPLAELREISGSQPVISQIFKKGIRSFIKRDFHPWQHDDAHLAQGYLTRVGLA